MQVLKLFGGLVAIGAFIAIFGARDGGGDASASAEPTVRTMSAATGGAKFETVAPRD